MESTSASSEARAAEGQLPDVVRVASTKFAGDSESLAIGMAEYLHQEIPELGGDDPDLLEATRASCESNIAMSYRLMSSGRPPEEFVVTPEARAYMRDLISRDLNVPVLLRTYRLGHAWIWELWADHLRVELADPLELARAIEFSSLWMFAYIDLVSAALAEDFSAELAQRVGSAEQLRTVTVREILAGESVDVELASGRLGYDLRRHHLALRLWSNESAATGLDEAVGALARALGAARPLSVHSGSATLEVWIGSDRPLTDHARAALNEFDSPSGIQIAIGGGQMAGVEGFRVAHSEAREAARIASDVPDAAGPVTFYRDVELVSLLAADPPRAERFALSRLGGLATDDPPTARLRQTALAFLACNGSSGRAAERLFVHQNTVTYRIHKAEEILGRPVTADPPELLCALILVERFGYGSSRPSQPS